MWQHRGESLRIMLPMMRITSLCSKREPEWWGIWPASPPIQGEKTMGKWTVTLDITVEADDRDDAFSKVEALLKDAESFCLYDAEEREDAKANDRAND